MLTRHLTQLQTSRVVVSDCPAAVNTVSYFSSRDHVCIDFIDSSSSSLIKISADWKFRFKQTNRHNTEQDEERRQSLLTCLWGLQIPATHKTEKIIIIIIIDTAESSLRCFRPDWTHVITLTHTQKFTDWSILTCWQNIKWYYRWVCWNKMSDLRENFFTLCKNMKQTSRESVRIIHFTPLTTDWNIKLLFCFSESGVEDLFMYQKMFNTYHTIKLNVAQNFSFIIWITKLVKL